MFKKSNMTYFQQLSALIDSAAGIDSKLPAPLAQLSPREEQCLVWAARGKTYQEIADILGLKLGEREDVSGYDASQVALHKLDSRGGRRGGDRRHSRDGVAR